MPHRLYQIVAARAGHRCEYCKALEQLSNSLFEVEHIQPRQVGGADEEVNLALACRACNGSKSTAVEVPDPSTGRVVRMFNPRTDIWDDHFLIALRTAEVIGLSDVGRATVLRLRMNDEHQRRARRYWILGFRFPADLPKLRPESTE